MELADLVLPPGVIRRILTEPLLHFLMLGALLFGLYGLVGGDEAPVERRIVVSQHRLRQIATTFERTWMRSPTTAELSGLVDDWVMEEILYREGTQLGLDLDDLIVRRRMRQKMEFLADDWSAGTDPSDGVLGRFLAEHPELFEQPERIDFEHVFVAAGAADQPARAAALLARLREGESSLGDATLLPGKMEDATMAEIVASFGKAVAIALASAPVGGWMGPVRSDFGWHLFYVATRQPAVMPGLEEVRGAVLREWSSERRATGRRKFEEGLRAQYEIEIEAPSEAAPATTTKGEDHEAKLAGDRPGGSGLE
ncbi:MAG: peptidyl-prolyl cis-trans isomerase [Deltaproteobacteria bacterium]|nr:peptidyl-prolyl cis-trans isomerase [Deltaproteobacteria bacterium]